MAQNQLKKLLGVGFGVAVTIGGTIGTGILRKPGPIAQDIGDPTLIIAVWLIVGVYALAGSLSVMELGTMLPKAGGWYVFAHRAFGNYAGFIIGISSWLGSVSAMAFGAAVMSEYTALLFPSAVAYQKTIAIGILILFVAFHSIGVRLASRAQEVMSVLKAVGLLAFVIVCFAVTPKESALTENTIRPLAEGGVWLGILAALQSVFYTYDGWHTAAYFTEEDVDPSRNLPRSMISGVLLIIGIYILVNLALLYVLPVSTLAGSKLPAADAIQLLFGPGSAQVVTFLLMISIMGIINAQIMFNPRVIFAMGRDGLFFRFVNQVNAGGTPMNATMLTAGASILMILTNTYGKLSDIATFFFVLCYASAFAALIRLRQTEPNLARPVRAWGYPFSTWLLLMASLAFLVGVVIGDFSSGMYAIGFIIVSYPVYLLIKR
ncbi:MULTISPECIES: APC family permease [unclassified Spirosoma]|uniref:APC family permease n=1 Tax=unclassified Spirosoma TaxID=2621999 RepID=UPI000966CFE7|nr:MULTISPECIES: APC family permease [unclassified Spirosoma]MBN8824016.1 APC family permease [Spirosoma sp.]OJW70617.1 MAG: amino acid permease [Spirosoma sp. 48-14]